MHRQSRFAKAPPATNHARLQWPNAPWWPSALARPDRLHRTKSRPQSSTPYRGHDRKCPRKVQPQTRPFDAGLATRKSKPRRFKPYTSADAPPCTRCVQCQSHSSEGGESRAPFAEDFRYCLQDSSIAASSCPKPRPHNFGH